ncbi:MYO5A [Symbiodinium sp. KB8]|nr:MYO5A [Symbiodinium sp. KB8]
MGVTCRACLEGPWYHKPHGAVGEKCYKHMISTGTVSSPLSVSALRKKGDAAPARAPDSEADEGGNIARAAPRPFSEQVRFETREGNVLLFDPGPLDKWIGTSCRWDSRRQRHVDTNTGDALSAEDSEDYQRYVQRHNQRRQTGNQADELIKLVATHNPAVEAELRFYIAKFPGEVRRLLAEGKQVYKPLVDKRRHGGTPSAQTAEPRHQRGEDKKTKKEIEKQKVKKGEKASKHKKHEKDKKDKKHKKAKKSRQEAPSGGEGTAEQQPQDEANTEPPTHEEVDWGSEGDDTETQAAVKAKAMVGEQRSDDSPPAMPLDAMWPWGERGDNEAPVVGDRKDPAHQAAAHDDKGDEEFDFTFCNVALPNAIECCLAALVLAVAALILALVHYKMWRHLLDNKVVGEELEKFSKKYGYLQTRK